VPAAPPAPMSVCASSMKQDDGLRRGLHLLDHLPEAVFELAFHARAGLQKTDVEREYAHLLEHRRHIATDDARGKAFDHRRLADARLAGEIGLFCRRRMRMSTICRISSSRPSTGSSFPDRARAVR